MPTGTAIFDNTGLNQSLNISATASIITMLFNAGAPAYSFAINSGDSLIVVGAGIVNTSSNAPNFLVTPIATLSFTNSSTAGNAVITNNANFFSAVTTFSNSSTAGTATIINTNLGFTSFNDSSTAGNATITSDLRGFVAFLGSSTAGNANITNNALGSATFSNNSTAGNCNHHNQLRRIHDIHQYQHRGQRDRRHQQRRHDAIFPVQHRRQCRVHDPRGWLFDMSGLIVGMTAGSIEGRGTYFLGSKTLTVGGNNLSTTVNGTISDGGAFGGTGGSLVKVGTGR